MWDIVTFWIHIWWEFQPARNSARTHCSTCACANGGARSLGHGTDGFAAAAEYPSAPGDLAVKNWTSQKWLQLLAEHLGMGQNLLPYDWNNHPLISHFKVPRVSGFWPITTWVWRMKWFDFRRKDRLRHAPTHRLTGHFEFSVLQL